MNLHLDTIAKNAEYPFLRNEILYWFSEILQTQDLKY